MPQPFIGGGSRVGHRVHSGKEREIFAGRQFGIQEEIVPKDADRSPQSRTGGFGVVRAVANAAAAGP